MKRKKNTGSVEETEACEVWLDTTNLKKKRRQPPAFCSKLLNPLAGRTYNIPVGIHFTQSRAPQLRTKQTDIATFFTANRQGNASVSGSTKRTESAHSCAGNSVGINCRSKWDDSISDMDNIYDEHHVSAGMNGPGNDWPAGMVGQVAEPVGGEHFPSFSSMFSPSLGFKEEELNPDVQLNGVQPDSNRDRTVPEPASQITRLDNSTIETLCLVQKDSSSTQPDFTEDSQGNRVIAHGKLCKSSLGKDTLGERNISIEEFTFGETAELERFKRGLLNCEKLKTSTQRSSGRKVRWKESKAALLEVALEDTFTDEKENLCLTNAVFTLQSSPNQINISKSQHLKNWPQENSAKGGPGHQTQGSAVRKAFQTEEVQTDSDTQALLFTQDSQGNKVIAHHVLKTDSVAPGYRIPLKEQTNQDCGWDLKEGAHSKSLNVGLSLVTALKTDVDSDQEGTDSESRIDWLFTQDSEGNTVIKHY